MPVSKGHILCHSTYKKKSYSDKIIKMGVDEWVERARQSEQQGFGEETINE